MSTEVKEYVECLMNWLRVDNIVNIRKNIANLGAIENRYFEAKEGDSNDST